MTLPKLKKGGIGRLYDADLSTTFSAKTAFGAEAIHNAGATGPIHAPPIGEALTSVTGTVGDDTWLFDSFPNTGFFALAGGDGIDTVILDLSTTTDPIMAWMGNALFFGSTNIQFGGDIEVITIVGNDVSSQIDFSFNNYQINFTGGLMSDWVWSGMGADRISGRDGIDYLNGFFGNDTLHGGAGADQLHGDSGDDLLIGGADADQLEGDSGNDTLNGNDGDDQFLDWDGDDEINGGAGNDLIQDQAGTNLLTGGAGDDTIASGSGVDTVAGGDGNDYVDTGAGDDSLLGAAGLDTLQGGDGADTLRGGADADSLTGGTGADELSGGAGDDVLLGGDDADILLGGGGADVLNGGGGNDMLTGGGGADSFVHSGLVLDGTDQINGFSAAAGDAFMFSDFAAMSTDFTVSFGVVTGAGSDAVDDVSITYVPTGEVIWVLADPVDTSHLYLTIGGTTTDLMI